MGKKIQTDLFGAPVHKLKSATVFVPGGMPSLTYVSRTERDLETRLASAKDNLCKLVTLTGSTKSGKTVLANKLFPRTGDAIWVDGGTVGTEDDLWTTLLADLGGATHSEEGHGNEFGGNVTGEAHGKTSIIFASGGVKGTVGVGVKSSTGRKRGLAKTPRAAAIALLRETKKPLVIDDFHYLERDLQGKIVRALKPLIFEGQAVICIAIPHRRYDVIKVEKEMTGRVESISVPSWSDEELSEIPNAGFPLLNVDLPSSICHRLANEAYGSPHLMQEFCRKLALENGIVETSNEKTKIATIADNLFRAVAEGTGKVIFDKLIKGPRQRSDRKPRPLVSGGTADVYQVVLLGLEKLAPGMQKVDYESLRTAIKSVLIDSVPQAHEVSRVLEKMAEIASSDEASTPVIDWDKEERQLHITDPFFAFFLKWGLENKNS